MNLFDRIALAWRILRFKKGAMYRHAERELAIVSGTDKDELQSMMNKSILEIVAVFSTQGHSGSTAPYAISVIEKLLGHKPLLPLFGTEDEWVDVGHGLYQNNRLSTVFKKDGVAYDINARVFIDESGYGTINGDSRVNITFPYVQKIEYIEKVSS